MYTLRPTKNIKKYLDPKTFEKCCKGTLKKKDQHLIKLDWLQSLKHFFLNVSYHILVASLTRMALFLKQSHQSKISYKYMIWHIEEKKFKDWTQST